MTRLVILVALALIVATCSFCRFVQRVDGQKRQKVLELTNQIPIYPSFHEVGKHELANANAILITKYFTSEAKYDLVKDSTTLLADSAGLEARGRTLGTRLGS